MNVIGSCVPSGEAAVTSVLPFDAVDPGYDRLRTLIEQRASRYADDLELKLGSDDALTQETELLVTFERIISGVLDQYPVRRRRKSRQLLFRSLYDQLPVGPTADAEFIDGRHAPRERRRLLLVALMAAEVEASGPVRLTLAQNKDLAEILERLGRECLARGLRLHAAEAFERAAEIHLLTKDHSARDRCLYQQARARHQITPLGWRRALLAVSAVTCGYGYRPYLLMVWMLVQLFVLWVLLALVSGAWSLHNLHVVAVNYINPVDADGLARPIKTMLIVGSYCGLVSLNVFFALLVRRWFR